MTERVESEHKEALCYCGYCQSPRFATHQVRTRDAQTEDVCGIHKRAFDVTGLATERNGEPTQRDIEQAQYAREVIRAAPERTYESDERELNLLRDAFSAGLEDAAIIARDGCEGAGNRAFWLRLSRDTYRGIQDPTERRTRQLIMLGYDSGLDVGIKALAEDVERV